MIIPPWFSDFSSAQKKEESSHSSRWIQLATIGVDNTPRVRTVVFRGWNKFYEMQIYTDIRSQKYNELNNNNNVEICCLFVNSKCQFRFRGKSKFDIGKDNENLFHWNKLDGRSKSMWLWPNPGGQFVFYEQKYLSLKTDEEIPDNFGLLKIEITHVDQLILNKTMHVRRKWIKKEEWFEERINP